MAKPEVSSNGFASVENYARTRRRIRGDLYGWARLEDDLGTRALFMVAHDVSTDSFPRFIDGVEVVLKRVGPAIPHRKGAENGPDL